MLTKVVKNSLREDDDIINTNEEDQFLQEQRQQPAQKKRGRKPKVTNTQVNSQAPVAAIEVQHKKRGK
jgi:hypothetical protein